MIKDVKCKYILTYTVDITVIDEVQGVFNIFNFNLIVRIVHIACDIVFVIKLDYLLYIFP